MKKKELKRIDIKNITDPSFLRDLSYAELDALSEDIRKYIIESTSINGGHLSSNLGVVESTIALCRVFDFSKDKIIFDVGHQSYTYKVLTGRSLDRLRKKDGVAGYQRRCESLYDHYEAGHSSTSISAASGLAIARDLKHEKYDVVAFIGDSSFVNGVSLEGINNIPATNSKVIIIINNNEMSISKSVGGMSHLFRNFSVSNFYLRAKRAYAKASRRLWFFRRTRSFFARIKNWFKRHLVQMTVFDILGYSVIGPVNGHNIKEVEKALEKAKKMDNSVIILMDTIKGKGYSFAETDEAGKWHGVGKFDIETGEPITDNSKTTWSDHYASILSNQMGENDKIVTVVPATGLGSGLKPVFEKYPTRCFDVGISEEHGTILGAGLAVGGFHPVISMYSTFLQRAYDEISHDLARMELNATILIDRAGLVGSDGTSHQGLYDESYLMSIPNTVIAMASNPAQSDSLFKESLNSHGVFAIRYPRESFVNDNPVQENIPFGKWKKEMSGGNAAIVSVGPATTELKEILSKKKEAVTLYAAIYLKPMDEDAIADILNKDKIIIYDAYGTEKGFAMSLSASLAENSYKGKLMIKTIPDAFVEHATIQEQREKYGLTPEEIAALI